MRGTEPHGKQVTVAGQPTPPKLRNDIPLPPLQRQALTHLLAVTGSRVDVFMCV